MIKNLRVDFSKNTKLKYYVVNIAKLCIPDYLFQKKLNSLLKDVDNYEYIEDRVNYYNKLDSDFVLPDSAITIKKFKKEKKKTYFFDLIEHLRYFNPNFRFSHLFGDITTVPQDPSFLKSRPIDGDNKNSILMKLNKVRHFIFVNDKVDFKDKKDMLVWRGKCYIPHRQEFIQKHYNTKFCDIGQTNTKGDLDVPWQKPKMKLKEQLNHKFILAIEGNDVASNLKWVMSSNSLAVMPEPTYETWFMEGKLIPNVHYVRIKDDYSDLEERLNFYIENPDEAQKIIDNAHKYVSQFMNKKKERAISLMVMDKYFEMTN